MKPKKKKYKIIFNIGMVLLFGLLTAGVMGCVYISGIYPAGSDTMCHVYKGERLYQEIRNGNLYPLLDMRWYNGVEILRYWAPLPVYVMAGCIAIAFGNLFYGYLLYVGIVFFGGALVWLVIGNKLNRAGMGAFLGILWFFMPNNLYALFEEGNLPRSLCMVLLPWLFYQIYAYCIRKKGGNLAQIIVVFALITLCHLGYAGMILIALVLYFIAYSLSGGKLRKGAHCFVAMLLGMLVTGIWAYASLQGGITATDSSEVMKSFFQPLSVSLNPYLRVTQLGRAPFYYGLAALLVAVLGAVAGRKGSRAYFSTAVVILLLTSSTAYPILARMPLGQYLWMLRFISIALCMIFMGLLVWETFKRKIMILCCVLLVLDVIPSVELVSGNLSAQSVEERMTHMSDISLITRAKEITKQRVAFMDQTRLESIGAYLLSDYRGETNTTFGAGWQSASTAENIVMLNESMDRGRYLFLFDRCLELGNDTVLVSVSNLQYGADDIGRLDEAAVRVGYELVEANEGYRLYHMETPEQFGVISKYSAIAIGSAATSFVVDYPGMEIGKSHNINDFTFGELKDYKLIYLDGFTYYDKSSAEDMLIELSKQGVKIVISAAGIPVDKYMGVQSFLGVVCQSINFSNGYPIMSTVDGEIDANLFPEGHTNWKTVYLEGLDKCYATIQELDHELQVLGTVKNENIAIVGLGLAYHYELTGDSAVGGLLSQVMTMDAESLPERRIVPLEVVAEGDRITIQSDYDNVNTTLAFHHNFTAKNLLTEKNNLLYVNSGTTAITMKYPYLIEGGLISIAAFLGSIALVAWVNVFWKKRKIAMVEVLDIPKPAAETVPSGHSLVPDGAKYTVDHLEWWDSEDNILSEETMFMPGKYQLHVVVKALRDEEFSREPEGMINGLKTDEIKYLGNQELEMVLSFTVAELFKFVVQPQGGEGTVNQEMQIEWRISQSAKVGYIQTFENNSWIIIDTVPNGMGEKLTYKLKESMVGESMYRIIYVLGDGKTVCSDDFTVNWVKKS